MDECKLLCDANLERDHEDDLIEFDFAGTDTLYCYLPGNE